NVAVHDLQLNQSLNTLTAGTYGRSAYQFFLDDYPSVPPALGGLRAVSGASTWTGPILLLGDPVTNTVTVSANGSQALQNGISAAQINIVGPISDLVPGSNVKLNKVGQGDVILSGLNTYGGVTEIKEGQLVVHSPQALGSPAANTIVDPGTALVMEADLELEPVSLNGDGIQPPFNGHNTGALRNRANNNTFTGILTLATDSTIGVDSGSTLTIGTKSPLLGTGTITDAAGTFNLTKELTGTLILAGADAYDGKTEIQQGALQVQHGQALGGTLNGTDVFDGAQLQLQTPSTGPLAGVPVAVTGETVTLSGTGIFATGAMLNTGGNNTWRGPVTLDSKPVLLLPFNVPATTPP